MECFIVILHQCENEADEVIEKVEQHKDKRSILFDSSLKNAVNHFALAHPSVHCEVVALLDSFLINDKLDHIIRDSPNQVAADWVHQVHL